MGEPLGHTWEEATCILSKTCSVCGETEGEALGHTADQMANYQDDSVCTVCGEVLEEAFTAVFAEAKIPVQTTMTDFEIPYNTLCYEDNTLTTTGKMYVSDFEVIDGSETLEALDGYKWIRYSINLKFGDDNAWEHGASWGFRVDDYYNPTVVDDSVIDCDEENELYKYQAYYLTINWHGKDYDKCIHMDDPDAKKPYTFAWNDKVLDVKMCRVMRVPEGYDGIVVSAINKKYESDIEYITDLNVEDKNDYASVRLPAAE